MTPPKPYKSKSALVVKISREDAEFLNKLCKVLITHDDRMIEKRTPTPVTPTI